MTDVEIRKGDGPMVSILPGGAVAGLLESTGWTKQELAERVSTGRHSLSPVPTAETVEEWGCRERLSFPLSACLHLVAGEHRLAWRRGRWVPTRSVRLTGADVLAIRSELGWSQERLARELDTRQQSVAVWESHPDKPLSGLASYALRALRRLELE